jgi:tRNA threonylcarbamoyl adenosine modification protein (Sua5/YciO/YrdC/YwlC family)
VSQYFRIHPDNPQVRLIRQAVEIVRAGGVVVYPTDTAYAIGCHINDKAALDRIIRIRRLDEKHLFTLLCRDLSDIATFAKVDNSQFRLLKAHTPGPYTFILQGTTEVPRRLMHEKRKTIGIRVPANNICQALLAELGEPLITATLLLPGDEYPLTDPEEIRDRVQPQVDLIIDGGFGALHETTVVSLLNGAPEILREGAGPVDAFA